MQFPVYYLWYGVIYKNDSIPTKNDIEKIYEYASELDFFLHFPILKLLFPSKFCWYFWYFISETYIFSGLTVSNYNLHDTYIINAVPCSYLWYGVIYKHQYTDKTLTLKEKKSYVYASERSERA